jgi:hypothetical protein
VQTDPCIATPGLLGGVCEMVLKTPNHIQMHSNIGIFCFFCFGDCNESDTTVYTENSVIYPSGGIRPLPHITPGESHFPGGLNLQNNRQ